ncbi:hypothetical protein C8J56DRAFT_1045181 [Mycena floridula]|nr:hypothetical protein C8J56DRAFT_1045181 [Mycena floridula]
MKLHDTWQHTLASEQAGPRNGLELLELFNVDIFPGDRQLQKGYLVGLSSEFNETMAVIADILYRLVIIRYYLGRSAEEDLQIYYISLDWQRVQQLSWVESEDQSEDYASAKKSYLCCVPTLVEGTVKATLGEIGQDTMDLPIIPMSMCDVASSCLVISAEHRLFPGEEGEEGDVPFYALGDYVNYEEYRWEDKLRVPGLDGEPFPKTDENKALVGSGKPKRKSGASHEGSTQTQKRQKRERTADVSDDCMPEEPDIPVRRSGRRGQGNTGGA